MKILVAPLNWGLGHATRCAVLVRRYLAEGHEVVLGGDGDSLVWMRHYFPQLRYVQLASLELTYSKRNSQVGAMLCALPRLIRWSWEDAARLRQLLATEPFDLIISDNRFGLYVDHGDECAFQCVYITHQLWIRLPHVWRWLEPLTARIHARIYNRFDEVWVPDIAHRDKSLSGILGHPDKVPDKVQYISPLSRFEGLSIDRREQRYQRVVLLSGLEPQRSLFEDQEVLTAHKDAVTTLVVRGKVKEPFVAVTSGNVTKVPWLDDNSLASALTAADEIVCRSGYSTVMDLAALGVLQKTRFVPTPGQPEQEYLANLFARSDYFL
ncbi:MAG: hypothetical protein MJZ75_01460 [Paludibacteraceae bacterium]|nr:hypothetical protein [Paludibacteraceae bacterium]